MDIYTSQYAKFKENNSLLDSKLHKITTIYEGFCIDIMSETALSAENVNFAKVGELIKSAPSKVTSSDKSNRLMGFNLGWLEEMTNAMLNLILTLNNIKTDWIRHQADFTINDIPMKKNVKWMVDRAVEWQNFGLILIQGLKQLISISQWQELEREQ